jgi:hypothetical protein
LEAVFIGILKNQNPLKIETIVDKSIIDQQLFFTNFIYKTLEWSAIKGLKYIFSSFIDRGG